MKASEPGRIGAELGRRLRGEVLDEEVYLRLYSTDASLYEILPLAVVLPACEEDVVRTVHFAADNGIPILARGAGTSLAGQAVLRGIVVDFSKYLRRILEVDLDGRSVRVEPGVVLDNLNAELAEHRLFFAPDVATSSRATIGGMVGNNSSGLRSVRYGKTVDHVLEMRALLSSRAELRFGPLDRAGLERACASPGTEGEIYRGLVSLIGKSRQAILDRYPKVMRRVSGYNLDELLDSSNFNVAKLMVGSEGTLGVVTEVKLRLEPLPMLRRLAVLHFSNQMAAIQNLPAILRLKPTALEFLDRHTVELAKFNPSSAGLCAEFLSGSPDALLLVEFSGDDEDDPAQRIAEMRRIPELTHDVYAVHLARTPAEQARVWAVRKSALGILASAKGDFRPVPFIEDSCVPVEHLAEYVEGIQDICRVRGRGLTFYAHAGVGVLHFRPLLNLKQTEDLRLLQEISEEAFQLVRRFGGSWSGEHGDGLARSYKLREFFGDEVYEAFREVKRLFDPVGLMNPGKIVDAPLPIENLRISPGYQARFPPTYYRFESEGGFGHAVELCTGVGHCRKTVSGVMCPSYIATLDEKDSTRGRANALRAAISGQLGADGLFNEGLFEVMDLCLECKACKSECPSSVDMAKMKAEFLAHYQERHGVPMAHRVVASTRNAAEIGSLMPGIFNRLVSSHAFRRFLERVAGFDRRRKLPELAGRTLVGWFRRRQAGTAACGPTVNLFVDTFTNYYEPEAGIAAVQLLEAMDFEVRLAEAGCCGRPLISAGLLKRARRQGERVIARLASAEGPVVVLEPSCFATLRDDYLDLLGNPEMTRAVVARVFALEEFLVRPEVYDRFRNLSPTGPPRILFHGHCQQKALIGSEGLARILGGISGSKVMEAPAGCCGMAGAFGYQKRHYDLSRRIGERSLLQAVRAVEPETTIVVPGFSCRSQVRDFEGVQAVHPATVLWEAVERGR